MGRKSSRQAGRGPTILREDVERSLRNTSDIQDASRRAFLCVQATQPLNTQKVYRRPQREWRAWCGCHGFADGIFVMEGKLVLFLEEVVLRVLVPSKQATQRSALGKRKRGAVNIQRSRAKAEDVLKDDVELKGLLERMEISVADFQEVLDDDRVQEGNVPDIEAADAAEGSPLAPATVECWISAVLELWTIQSALDGNSTPNPRGPAAKALTRQLGQEQRALARANYMDHSADGIHSGYSAEEFQRLNTRLLKMSSGEHREALRTCLNVLLGHFFVLCGEQWCDPNLSDLSCLLSPEEEGHTHAVCLVL